VYKKILIINPFGIGDVLFTTPIIHALKDALPDIKIGYLCNRRTASILESNPYVDYVFIYERDEFEAIRKKSYIAWLRKIFVFSSQIKKEQFDLALDFSLNTQYGFFSWLAGIKERIGYDFKKRGRFLTKKVKLLGYCDMHIVDYYANLLKYLELELKYKKLELYLNNEDIKQRDKILSKESVKPSDLLVGIIPGAGASWGKEASLKHWPAEKFAQLSDKIIENYQAKIIIMGDFSEKEIAKKVIETMQHKAIDLSGKTTIGELAALLSKTKLIITNDGGPLHMAVALGIKSISIFGLVDEKVYGPYPSSENHIVIKKDLDCRPCYQKFRLATCLRDRECIKSISSEEVFAAVRRLL
jgi:lipopolysaccharide heptosyltransferase II